ncbi:MAG: hypothetical protein J5965_13735, partial [Aeriscardovia sp.]|nr:hypothetical protein [Aeriscardovia sp.]
FEFPQLTPGRDLVQLDKKRREARTKGQVTHKCDLLFCSGLHRLFTKEINRSTNLNFMQDLFLLQ